jgi:Zn-dependent protease with chaperone function
MNTLTFFLVVSIAMVVFTYWKTITSDLSRDRKLALYIITFIAPIIGLILFFVFKKQYSREKGIPV